MYIKTLYFTIFLIFFIFIIINKSNIKETFYSNDELINREWNADPYHRHDHGNTNNTYHIGNLHKPFLKNNKWHITEAHGHIINQKPRDMSLSEYINQLHHVQNLLNFTQTVPPSYMTHINETIRNNNQPVPSPSDTTNENEPVPSPSDTTNENEPVPSPSDTTNENENEPSPSDNNNEPEPSPSSSSNTENEPSPSPSGYEYSFSPAPGEEPNYITLTIVFRGNLELLSESEKNQLKENVLEVVINRYNFDREFINRVEIVPGSIKIIILFNRLESVRTRLYTVTNALRNNPITVNINGLQYTSQTIQTNIDIPVEHNNRRCDEMNDEMKEFRDFMSILNGKCGGCGGCDYEGEESGSDRNNGINNQNSCAQQSNFVSQFGNTQSGNIYAPFQQN